MYHFSLNNKYGEVFARIEYSEEQALHNLYDKGIPFIVKLLERYYSDCIFSIGELKNAQKDLVSIMALKNWNLDKKEEETQLHLIYKLLSIISYAVFHDCSLMGSGD